MTDPGSRAGREFDDVDVPEEDRRDTDYPDSHVPDQELGGSDIPAPVPEDDVPDPDVAAARAQEEEQPDDESDALVTDELLPEERMTEFEAPVRPSLPTATGHSGEDERRGEGIEERLGQEQE